MATHSSSLAWEITWTEEPGRLQSMGSQSWTFARKVIPNLDSLLKSKDISLPAKVCIVKAMVFPVVINGCELDYKELSAEELMLLNCGVGEDS